MNNPTVSVEAIAEHQKVAEVNARFRKFGYDMMQAGAFVLREAMPLSGSVLEVGTGKGRFLVELAKRVDAVTTLDVCAEEQASARLAAQYAGVEDKIRFVLQDAGKLSWPDATFDAAVTMNAIHHIPHFPQVLEEMVRVVKPGGKIVLVDFTERGFQILERLRRSEGKTHPREIHDFADLECLLKNRGLATRYAKGFKQEVLVATLPAGEG